MAVSIIISALDEPYVEQTIGTIYQRTPYDLIEEIIIVDDFSNIPVQLDYPKVKILRNTEREGLVRSRIKAAEICTAPLIVSIDPHVKVGDDWIEPLIERVESNYKCIAIPLTRGLDPKTWQETSGMDAQTGWRWDLDFYWRPDNGVDETPSIAGHCFMFTKQWWLESGKFDPGLRQWGCENIEFSLRTWLCGGTVEVARKSVVAHWFKDKFSYTVDADILLANKARVAEVWFGNHKQSFYNAVHKKPSEIDFGDISDRLAIRDALQVRDFDWFLNSFQPELKRLSGLRGKHQNSKVAILGSGPSLDNLDMADLEEFDIVIGVNYNALLFDCDYAVFHDLTPLLDVRKSGKYDDRKLVVPIKLKDHKPRWAPAISDGLVTFELGSQDDPDSLQSKNPPFFHHASTVHTAMHFAAYIGARSVTLFGCDSGFSEDGRSHTKIIPQYKGGYYWPKNKDTMGYLSRMERGYKLVEHAFNGWGIRLTRTEHV